MGSGTTSVDQGASMRTTPRTRPSSRRRLTRSLAAVGLTLAAALTSVAVTTSAHAEIQPCDPFDPGCNPLEYEPPRYDAIGKDRDLDDAQAEAEAEAAAHCPGGNYDIIRIRVSTLPNGNWQYTLTYACS
jgi:hypothetical protein